MPMSTASLNCVHSIGCGSKAGGGGGGGWVSAAAEPVGSGSVDGSPADVDDGVVVSVTIGVWLAEVAAMSSLPGEQAAAPSATVTVTATFEDTARLQNT